MYLLDPPEIGSQPTDWISMHSLRKLWAGVKCVPESALYSPPSSVHSLPIFIFRDQEEEWRTQAVSPTQYTHQIYWEPCIGSGCFLIWSHEWAGPTHRKLVSSCEMWAPVPSQCTCAIFVILGRVGMRAIGLSITNWTVGHWYYNCIIIIIVDFLHGLSIHYGLMTCVLKWLLHK